ncbi:SNF2-related protein [Amycolatopsis sp. cmx-8-4]|uniref:DEAD/DEAH box helicase n=1 Tax=Amycolatopsis sp. cmx-8-4 TaxID=2790947 RepID=UPI00397A4488
MQLVTLTDVDETGLERAVGSTSYARGLQYAQQRAVVAMRWDTSENALYGAVQGTGVYETTAYFSSDGGFAHGTCDCPVGFNCKHVVALVLTAADPARARTRSMRSPTTGRSATPRTPAWETSLGSLVQTRQGSTTNRPSGTPLAIELTLASSARPTLVARLVKPGKNTWIGSGLSWTKLSSLRHHGDYLTAHVSLLQELYVLYQSRVDASRHYSYGEVKSLDLAAFESRRLWPLLDEADAVGVRLVHGKKHLGEVERYGSAELCLDVTQGERPKSLEVTPAIGVDSVRLDAVAIRFIGSEGHGLVYVDRADAERTPDPGDWHLRLARLTNAAPPQLQQMTLENQRLSIPGTQVSRFRDEYYPRLRHLATVISSDGAFTPPEISDPTLVLRASYGPGHDLDLKWEWAYDVGDSRLRAPLRPDPAGGGYRDLERERAILADLGIPFDGLNPIRADDKPTAPATGLPTPTAPHTALGGVDTMRFTTEILPLLIDRPAVTVEIDGEQADYREAGDSLTIGVSAEEVEGEPDWFGLGVTISVEGHQVPFTEVFLALAGNDSHMLLPSGAYFSLEKPELQALRKLIEEARALQDSPGGPLKISRFQVGLWDELAALGVVEHQAKAWRLQLAGLRSISTLDSTEPPSTLEAHLRPYQLDGFRWLTFLWKFQLGGILADDMGLGKTLQTLALICHAKHDDPTIAPFLVVAPTSVVSNWTSEAARFAPGLKVAAISETQRRRGQPLDEVIADADVVVTSYTLFRLEVDAYSELPWSGLVLDEAQFTKNHHSKIYQCARTLSAPFKLAITGTPMENNLMELWSLLSITAPGLFPNPTRFEHYYARPIEKRGETELLTQFRRRIKPLVKRRSKEQVAADLPAKQEQILEVELHPRHRKIYETHLQRERQKILGLVDDLNKNRFTIFRSLTLLRQLSLHAALIDEKHRKVPCAKVEALSEQLQDVIDGGHRALIFSQFTGFLDVVRQHLDAEGIEYCYLDGNTRNRAAVLEQFKDGSVPVFLISLKAGGFGLNLTEADYCFLLDPWWNPATEAQAIDRTHRIGQSRNVMVYRLIAKDTIEEKVMALKAKKAALVSSVMDDGNAFGTTLDADDIRGLLV